MNDANEIGTKKASLVIRALAPALPGLSGLRAKPFRAFYDSVEKQRIRVGDIDVAYKVFGEGEPLVLISAYMATMARWDAHFLQSLAAEYRVIIFDNRGMGDTTSGRAQWTIDRFAADTAGLIRALGLEKAHVLGYSLGGDIALSLAVNFPEVVDRIICYAGDCGGQHKVPPPSYREVMRDFRHVATPMKWAVGLLFPPVWMAEHPFCWKTIPLRQGKTKWRSIRRQNRAYNKWQGVYPQLPDIGRPTLVVTGTEDASTPPGNADILAQQIPGAQLVRFEGAGHGLMYQHPVELSGIVKQFLRSPDGSLSSR